MLRKMDMVKKDFSSVLGYEKMQKFNEFHVSKIKIKYIGIYIYGFMYEAIREQGSKMPDPQYLNVFTTGFHMILLHKCISTLTVGGPHVVAKIPKNEMLF